MTFSRPFTRDNVSRLDAEPRQGWGNRDARAGLDTVDSTDYRNFVGSWSDYHLNLRILFGKL